MFYTSSSGKIELQITLKQANIGSHPGQCDGDVAYLRNLPTIKRQLNKLNPELLRDELREYGAWDDTELSDHDANLSRLLWVACGDIVESKFHRGG